MRVLLLAPHPFFQVRGTPIAVRLMLEVLSKRILSENTSLSEAQVLTYDIGEKLSLPGIKFSYSYSPGFCRKVRPGASFCKLILDFFFFFSAISLIIRSKDKKSLLVHAVEESVFIALLAKLFWGIPYVYDMDSLLSKQITDRFPGLAPVSWFLGFFEDLAIKYSDFTLTMCESLSKLASKRGAKNCFVLQDISLLGLFDSDGKFTLKDKRELNTKIETERIQTTVDLRAEARSSDKDILAVYIGNLEPYQGTELMLNALADPVLSEKSLKTVFIGGSESDIGKHKALCLQLGLSNKVVFLGPKPLFSMRDYHTAADILLAPRISGENTAMKIYTYMEAGRAILATDLPTNTQVLTSNTALLVKPNAAALASGLLHLIENPDLRERLGRNAQRQALCEHSFSAFSAHLNKFYQGIEKKLKAKGEFCRKIEQNGSSDESLELPLPESKAV